MPVQFTYPGVYVQPLIAPQPPTNGVPTSIGAFIGRTPMGPVNQPTLLNNYGDYQRAYGQLNLDSTVSYMVSDFYNNGGQQTYVVRLFNPWFPTYDDQQAALADAAKVGAAAKGAKTAADAVKAMKTYISKRDAESDPIANAVVANFTAITDAMSPAPTEKEIPDLLAEAQNEAAPYGKAVIDVSQFNIAADAALQTAKKAVQAASGSPQSNASVIASAKQAAAGYTQAPAMTAAKDVATAAATKPSAKLTYMGQYAGIQAALGVFHGLGDALGMAKSKDESVSTMYSNDISPLVTAAKQFKPTGKSTDPLSAKDVTNFFSKAPANLTKAATDAADAAADKGEDVGTVMLAAVRAVVELLSDSWPETLKLEAANEGTWGNFLSASTNTNGITPEVVTKMGVPRSTIFNLVVNWATPSGQAASETFNNVTIDPNGGHHQVGYVLQHQSNLVRLFAGPKPVPSTFPSPASGTGTGGTDSQPLSLDDYLGTSAPKTGIHALDQIKIFNILCIPPDQRSADLSSFNDTDNLVYSTAAEYCSERYAMLIIDSPNNWWDEYTQGNIQSISLSDLGSYSAEAGRSAAVYFPRVIAQDPTLNGRNVVFPPCGAIAGIWAATDLSRGVWKSPAGLTAAFNGIQQVQGEISDAENGILNPQGIDVLRNFNPGGSVVWGARTLRGADQLGDEYKYVSVQRTLLYIEASLLQDTKWAVFEPNDETLWSGLRTQVSSFMSELFRQGAFAGSSPSQAYFVKCDASTNPQDQVVLGIVTVQVGFAPLFPAEFVYITIQQITPGSGS